MHCCVTVLPVKQNIHAASGENLLAVLRSAGQASNAPCGGAGNCGKCKVVIDGAEVLACRTVIDRDMTVTIPQERTANILTESIKPLSTAVPGRDGYLLAFDLGTTTMVGYLLDGTTGRELALESRLNPQAHFGADVISRIQLSKDGGYVMEGFTLALALVDAIPVLSFGISMVIIASRFYSPLFMIGAALSVLAGCCKVAWKMVLGIAKKDLRWLNKPFVPMQATGFLLMLVSGLLLLLGG